MDGSLPPCFFCDFLGKYKEKFLFKTNIKQRLFLLASAFLVFFSLQSTTFALSGKASNTIAGYSATLRSSVTSPQEMIIFRIEKPDGSIIEVQEQADETGVAMTDFLGFHTKKTGIYTVQAAEKGRSFQKKSTFEVFPEPSSSVHSQVRAIRDSVPANGSAAAKIRVSLKDRYFNPVPGHALRLISSRSGDTILPIGDGVTDTRGEMFFHITARQSGVSSFSVLDQKENSILEERVKIIFVEPEKKRAIGGNLSASIFGEIDGGDDNFGPIASFELEFPDTVRVGSDSNFLKIIALDKNGNVAKNYTGTVLISTPNDDNARLPGSGQYRFSDRDQGERQFDLALIFSKTGKQEIVVNDFEDGQISQFLKGKKEVEVIDECIGDDCSTNKPPQDGEGSIEIKSPYNGSEFASRRITLSGKAQPNINLTLFIDDRESAIIEVDYDGVFVDEFSLSSEGDHAIYLQEVEGNEERSETISFSIDTTPPSLDEIGIYPTGSLEPGMTYTVTVLSEPNLDAAFLQVAGTKESFQEDVAQAGKYVATLRAPQNPGEYGISITLTDTLKNSFDIRNAANIQVKSNQKQLSAPGDLQAKQEEGGVRLSWEAPPDALDRISKYRLFRGRNELFLSTDQEVSATTYNILIDDLDPEVTVFFTIAALDEQGIEGRRSPVLSITPKKAIPKNMLTVRPADGALLLSWSDPRGDVPYFDIRFGIESGRYQERFLISGKKKNITIPDLINGITYFVTVVPLDSQGVPTGETYPEASGKPVFGGIHPAPQEPPIAHFEGKNKLDDTGFEAFFLFFFSLFFATSSFFFHRAIRFWNMS